MSKEQILLVVAILLGGLVIWGSTGQYESAGSLPDGRAYDTTKTIAYSIPEPKGGPGRSLFREFRDEIRKEPPALELPPTPDLDWVPPLPAPGPSARHWGALRGPIKRADGAPGSGEDNGNSNAPDPDVDDPPDADVDDPLAQWRNKGREQHDITVAARIEFSDGTERRCKLVPGGDLTDKPTWELLERFLTDPTSVQFTAVILNDKGREQGKLPYDADNIVAVKMLHLERTLEKEFHERRVQQRVQNNNRQKLIDLARWAAADLAPRYHAEHKKALGLAIEQMKLALGISQDSESVRELAALYMQAFNPEGAIDVLEAYRGDDHQSDTQVVGMLAATYEMVRADHAAMELYKTVADTGDTAIRLALAEAFLRQGDGDRAYAEFEKVQNAANPEQKSHALEAMARILLRRGEFTDALVFANKAKSAKSDSAEAYNTLGSIQYALGKYAEAESSFATGAILMGDADTRARCNRGFALIALDRVQEGVNELQACLDTDPLNYFAPLVGLGQAYQRWGDLTKSNDYFQTALERNPGSVWILLRTGTAKLRDGQPAEALARGEQALAIEPGCVDALILVGRAAAELPEPDFAKSAAFLGRAHQKEAENASLGYLYARVLLLAGRVKEASKLLKEMTDVADGFARQDARTLLLAGYASYLSREDVEVIERELDRAILLPTISAEDKAYGTRIRDEIDLWNSTRLWIDNFDRNSSQVGAGWKETETKGPRVTVGKGNLIVTQKVTSPGGPAREATRVTRVEDLGKLISVEARFRTKNDQAQVIFHVVKGDVPKLETGRGRDRGHEIGFGVDAAGNQVLPNSAKFGLPDGSPSKRSFAMATIKDEDGNPVKWPADREFHTVKLVRTDHQRGIWAVYLDGELVKDDLEIQGLKRASNAKYELGFMIDGARNATVDVEVDWVKIERTNR